ncbi:UNVERIFIED_CONTAM: Homeobox-leucine zipper protein HAT22 [Sesamum angustifolium]|uniref:Homeobox-leucine zipper protein HAT22 n=1 Tax=Sesamum angustifolium TaxID=2727405 RepID=A0AAW2NKT8_9LAMI
MGSDDLCNTGLVLGLGLSSIGEKSKKPAAAHRPDKIFEPSLTLSLSGEPYDLQEDSAASSFSNVSVKREREIGAKGGNIGFPLRVSDEREGPNGRKKLRLSKAQSALLEESFKQHSTLNPKQKQDLARELNLRPRQVEVWFQNRRARTKLKQTEVDCEILKKCCESLTEENRRLQKELQELKALKLTQPLYMQLPAATLTMCPSCERIGGGGGGGVPENAAKSPYVMAPKPHFYNPFTNPSAAC